MSEAVEVEPQGDHEFVVRLPGDGEGTESWFRLSPGVLADLGVDPAGEEDLVRRTVDFLLQHQDAADFPDVVELEDVAASYDGHLDAVRPAGDR
ncbi:hypothetical protein SAMN05660690_2913 [Geodermatophilus telluris]|uniref:Uncharacterized protein n=1 Tax=Geodermatophilus telluris TaxID=1190417 RepID=A0A1G6QJ74_9ACTN|nr:hypothetical protein [Geodermatophilus telluris]SDC91727.1 hypothetical protein SAMN05660690_2913 [Geodermatophilus telluris]